jgi:hypothetical protein
MCLFNGAVIPQTAGVYPGRADWTGRFEVLYGIHVRGVRRVGSGGQVITPGYGIAGVGIAFIVGSSLLLCCWLRPKKFGYPSGLRLCVDGIHVFWNAGERRSGRPPDGDGGATVLKVGVYVCLPPA